MRHPYAEALCFQAFLQNGADIEAKTVREKDANIAFRDDGGREFAWIDPRRGKQLLEPTRRTIEPWFVKRSGDLRHEGILPALLEAREGVHRCAIAQPTLGRIVRRHGLGSRTAKRCFGGLAKLTQRLERHRVGAFPELSPNPASSLLVLVIQGNNFVASLRVRQRKGRLKILAELVLTLIVQTGPSRVIGEAEQVAWTRLAQHSGYALVRAGGVAEAAPRPHPICPRHGAARRRRVGFHRGPDQN